MGEGQCSGKCGRSAQVKVGEGQCSGKCGRRSDQGKVVTLPAPRTEV